VLQSSLFRSAFGAERHYGRDGSDVESIDQRRFDMKPFDDDGLVAVVGKVELADADQLELVLPGDGRRRHLALERGVGTADDGVSGGYHHPVVRTLLAEASSDADDVDLLGAIVLCLRRLYVASGFSRAEPSQRE